MRIDVVTIFPQMFERIFDVGVIGKARDANLIQFSFHNLRQFTTDKHKTVDDVPFGGGGGLIFKIEPLVRALNSIQDTSLKSRSILLSPRGRVFNHAVARELAMVEQLILFCGRYEGVDERFSAYVDQEISIGDFVLTGGEIASMVMMDAISRFIPGVVGQEEAPYQDSFITGALEYPHYTRPVEFEGSLVPEVLRSGNHERIREWRQEQSLNTTLQRRPDLLQNDKLTKKNINKL